MIRFLAVFCLWILAAAPAEAGLFRRKKQPPKATYGMSKEKQRKQASKARARMQKQRSKAIQKAPAIRAKEG